MGKNSIICTGCGYNTETGKLIGTDTSPRKGRACYACGYDMSGVPTARCPECGEVNTRRGRVRHQQISGGEWAKRELMRPAVYLSIGLPIALAVMWDRGGSHEVLVMFVLGCLSIPVMLVGHLIVATFLTGFDEPLWLAMARAIGMAALADGVACVVGLFAGDYVSVTAGIVVFVGLAMDALESDYDDACYFAAGTYLLHVIFVGGVRIWASVNGWF